jgi:hypothetical protein
MAERTASASSIADDTAAVSLASAITVAAVAFRGGSGERLATAVTA